MIYLTKEFKVSIQNRKGKNTEYLQTFCRNDEKCVLCEKNIAQETHHLIPKIRNSLFNKGIRVCSKCHGLLHGFPRPSNFSELVKAGQKQARKNGRIGKRGKDKKPRRTEGYKKYYEEYRQKKDMLKYLLVNMPYAKRDNHPLINILQKDKKRRESLFKYISNSQMTDNDKKMVKREIQRLLKQEKLKKWKKQLTTKQEKQNELDFDKCGRKPETIALIKELRYKAISEKNFVKKYKALHGSKQTSRKAKKMFWELQEEYGWFTG